MVEGRSFSLYSMGHWDSLRELNEYYLPNQCLETSAAVISGLLVAFPVGSLADISSLIASLLGFLLGFLLDLRLDLLTRLLVGSMVRSLRGFRTGFLVGSPSDPPFVTCRRARRISGWIACGLAFSDRLSDRYPYYYSMGFSWHIPSDCSLDSATVCCSHFS